VLVEEKRSIRYWKKRHITSNATAQEGGDMPMHKRKWFIPVIVASVLLIAGTVGGALVAASDSSSTTGNETQITDRYQALLDRACAIYQENTGVTLDSDQLKAALDQAKSELQEQALESQLQNLVDKGTITQGEADSYLQWWQSRPNIQAPLPGLGGPGPRGGMMWGGACPGPDASGEAAG
jgi:hypothetical protein